jgi:hypothetical protein
MAAKKYQEKYDEKAKKLAANRKEIAEQIKRPAHRPLSNVSVEDIEALAKDDYTAQEIAACLGISKETLYDRKDFSDALIRGRDKGNASMKKKLSQMIHDDAIPSVAIFMAKARLGYNDGGNLGTQVQQPFAQGQL